MVAYSFKRQFAEPILAGTKRQTIRADRKRHARPGEELQLYTGMRTKHCRLIGKAHCLAIQTVALLFWGRQGIIIDGVSHVSPAVLDGFARDDGFADWDQMRAFWFDVNQVVDEFHGVLIRWGGLHV